MKGLLSEKHYNRCWWIHETFSDVLERLFIKCFLLKEVETIHSMQKLEDSTDIRNCAENDQCQADVMQRYHELKVKGLNGEFGRTAQFWLMYMQMVGQLQQLHFAVNTNDFLLKIQSWEDLLPCFATNKVHYARYGTFYIQQLKHLEESQSGEMKEISSVRRNTFGIGQAVDCRRT